MGTLRITLKAGQRVGVGDILIEILSARKGETRLALTLPERTALEKPLPIDKPEGGGVSSGAIKRPPEGD